MHKYRRQAKYAAWYDEDPQHPSYNPFKKIRSRPLRGDAVDSEENGLVPIASESQFRPSSEETRKRELGLAGTHDEPERSVTLPGTSTHAPKSPPQNSALGVPRSESPIQEHANEETEPTHNDVKREGPAPNDFKESTESDTAVNSNNSPIAPAAENKPRQRKGFKGLMSKFKGGDENEKADVNRSNTGTSTGKDKPRYTVGNQLKATLFNSWINVLLIAVPIGIAVHFAKINAVGVFVVNFIAIIPLAALLSYSTEEIAFRTGEVLGGLLNASFGNAVELIVSIIALAQNQVLIVQTSLIGSMLSNLLLVMGMCFFFGGINRVEQHFNITVAQTASSLLALAIGSLIIPTAFHAWSNAGDAGVAPLSRGTAVILLFVYGCYLFFQLKTHTEIYNAPSQKVEKRNIKINKGEASHGIAQFGAMATAVAGANKEDRGGEQQGKVQGPLKEEEDEEEGPQLHILVAVATLAISTVFVALCAEFLVDSINALVDQGGISKTFVGLILLPIVGNAAEHATAVTVAVKDKMDLAIGVAVGSSMQIALLVLPFTVVLGWIMGKNDMTLDFDGFQIAILFVAVLLVNYLIQDGKSHWLEGVLLQTLYIIIAVAAWFYPAKGDVA